MTMRNSRGAWIFYLTLASASAALVSIAASEILLGMACLLWIVFRPRPLQFPAYTLPLLVFIVTTLLSLAMSPDPSVGGPPVRKFVLYIMGLLAANFVTDAERVRSTFKVLLAVAAVGSVTALLQFAFKERRFLVTGALTNDPMALDRVKGFMGHWMTFSGGQLLVWCAALPIIAWIGRRWIVPLLLVGISIVFTFTRSAWLGAGTGAALAALWMPKKELVRIVLPVLVVGLLASPFIYHRLSLSANGHFGPDYGRAVLLKVGVQMVREHPMFGVGVNRISTEFPKYYKGTDLNTFYYGHMQNDYMQIAAERGLVCFAAFTWFLVALFRSFWKFLKSDNATLRLTALSAVCALAGFLVMGLFEYNFGDSEPLILFLFIVSVPFGVHSNLDSPSLRQQ
jgi:O-antigen ligase